jgi:hypothetical protein
MLFDLATDPNELNDWGGDQNHAAAKSECYEALTKWSRTTRTQITSSDQVIAASDEAFKHYDLNIGAGVLIGYWDEAELVTEKLKRQAFLKSKRDPAP